VSLSPVPGNDITERNSPRLTPPWRAWFDSIRSAINTAQDTLANPYGSFHDSSTQSITSTTDAYPITLNTTEISSGVTIGSVDSHIIVSKAGIYNVQFSAQLVNVNVQDKDAQIWIRINGADVPWSTGFVSVPSSHGGVSGHCLPSWNYFLTMAANDYVEFFWQATSTDVTLAALAAGTTPDTPETPSMIVTVIRVGV
jgi:hypothetical protein